MAKKKRVPKREHRTDAERRARQAERLSRLLRVIRCIMGPGRWDAESLGRELEVSPRTVHRIMQTLSMAGVPWYYCKENECYRVRSGFKFPGVDSDHGNLDALQAFDLECVVTTASKVLNEGEQFLGSIRKLCELLTGKFPPKRMEG